MDSFVGIWLHGLQILWSQLCSCPIYASPEERYTHNKNSFTEYMPYMLFSNKGVGTISPKIGPVFRPNFRILKFVATFIKKELLNGISLRFWFKQNWQSFHTAYSDVIITSQHRKSHGFLLFFGYFPLCFGKISIGRILWPEWIFAN